MEYDRGLDDLAFEFFKEFARAEYALKASGFHKGEGNAEANWPDFAEQVEPLIQNPSSEALEDAINFILQTPPKKQVIQEGVIQWSESPPNHPVKAENLLIYVRRVRNNLFHGGKFNGHWFAPERSEALLRHCLVILRACIDFVDSAREAYNG
tara:strand:+ start:676 stop:1134 length:459 start_codon:yes stop_codon:yes gene_type:complete